MELENKLKEFKNELIENELATNTIDKYIKDIRNYLTFSNITSITDITKANLIDYKAYLISSSKVATVNNKLVILNKFVKFLGLNDYTVKLLKIQKKTSLENVMTNTDYERLQRMAKKLNKIKMYYIMKTLAETGIRIEELKFITVETIKKGVAVVNNKGKIRTIIITRELSKQLLQYCEHNNITSGIIFCGRNKDKTLDKAYIWSELKYIAGQARVNKSKIFAHNFRHMYAIVFMNKTNNVCMLADLLGHSSLETTRIYTKTSIAQQRVAIQNLYK